MNPRAKPGTRRRMAIALLCGALLLVLFAIGIYAEEELIPHASIEILGDIGFTAENGVVAGTGTSKDPYLIAGWLIDATGTSFGVHVEGTTKAFVIEGCRVFGASSTAINLVDIEIACITNCQMESSFYGLAVEEGHDVCISDNTFSGNEYAGLFLLNAASNDIHDNLFCAGGAGILFYEKAMNNKIHDNIFDRCKIGISILSLAGGGNHIYYNDFLSCRAASEACNLWDDGKGTGNYWSEYGRKDADGDGIGDVPYRIFGSGYESDYHPAMISFHPMADE
ncbi:MAG: NosD domain-containing protein [Candidatus Bipolaricaulota bacterium]|nr:NosD domain-containing protein [Candidatus Bipolaricaulota bacterium]